MATERQIAANRRNALKSTGPKSEAGKKRSSGNAYRHGLSVPPSVAETEAQLEELSRGLAADATGPKVLSLLKTAAGAQIDLARVRSIHTAMAERTSILANFYGGPLDPNMEERHPIVHVERTGAMRVESQPHSPMVDPSFRQPRGKREGRPLMGDAGHILAELTKILRYEKRAAGRRDRAICNIVCAKSRTRGKLQLS
jgi:hypothetical protein